MSKSPKYSLVDAAAARAARSQQQRAERERRRRERQAKEAAKALEKARIAARQRAAALERIATELHTQATRHGETGDVERFRFTLTDTLAEIGAATTIAQVQAADQALTRVERDQVHARSDLAERAERSAQEALAAVSALLGVVPASERTRFDPDRGKALDGAVDQVRSQLASGDAGAVLAAAPGLVARVREHLDAVLTARAAFDRLRDDTFAQADQVRQRLAVLREDARQVRIALPQEDLAKQGEEYLAYLLGEQRFQEAAVVAAQLDARADGLEQALDAGIDAVVQRRELMAAVIEQLPGLGLVHDPGSLTETPDGGIGIQARRAGGDAVSLVVEPGQDSGHRIVYLSSAVEDATSSPAGRVDVACDSIEALAERVNGVIAGAGFQVGPVDWEGRSPGHARRPPRSAVQLPQDGAPAHRVQP